jgi:hypothetical protein
MASKEKERQGLKVSPTTILMTFLNSIADGYEFFAFFTSLRNLYEIYKVAIDEYDNDSEYAGNYQFVFVTLTTALFSPYCIAYSALVKIFQL